MIKTYLQFKNLNKVKTIKKKTLNQFTNTQLKQ